MWRPSWLTFRSQKYLLLRSSKLLECHVTELLMEIFCTFKEIVGIVLCNWVIRVRKRNRCSDIKEQIFFLWTDAKKGNNYLNFSYVKCFFWRIIIVTKEAFYDIYNLFLHRHRKFRTTIHNYKFFAPLPSQRPRIQFITSSIMWRHHGELFCIHLGETARTWAKTDGPSNMLSRELIS